MFATIRDGVMFVRNDARGLDRLVEAGRRKHGLDDRLDEAGDEEGDADPQRRREDIRKRRIDLVEHVDGRAGDRFDPEHLERGNGDLDDDYREDEDAGRLGEAGPRRGGRGARRNRARVGADRAFGRTDAEPGEEAVDVGGDQHRLGQAPHDSRDDEADEEDDFGGKHMRQEGENLGDQLVDRARGSGRCRGTAGRP